MPQTAIPLIRPVRLADAAAVLRLARAGGNGLTNLPPDQLALEKRIAASELAVASEAGRDEGSAVLLVAELDGQIVATGMIFAKVGAEWPFYSYRITRQASQSRAVDRAKAQHLLNLVNDFDGETEVGGLFVDPDRRGLALGRLMARTRYLFIAAHRGWFRKRVMAELRGYQDENGASPVWEAIGRYFYDMDFHEADRTGAIHGNQFIADLGPRYPLYMSMLPSAAQAAFGRPHDDGRPARDMLLAEGFRDEGYVDIFDGGPTLVTEIDNVKTIRETEQARVAGLDEGDEPALIAVGEGASFRAAIGTIRRGSDGIAVNHSLAALLDVAAGDTLWLAPA